MLIQSIESIYAVKYQKKKLLLKLYP